MDNSLIKGGEDNEEFYRFIGRDFDDKRRNQVCMADLQKGNRPNFVHLDYFSGGCRT